MLWYYTANSITSSMFTERIMTNETVNCSCLLMQAMPIMQVMQACRHLDVLGFLTSDKKKQMVWSPLNTPDIEPPKKGRTRTRTGVSRTSE